MQEPIGGLAIFSSSSNWMAYLDSSGFIVLFNIVTKQEVLLADQARLTYNGTIITSSGLAYHKGLRRYYFYSNSEGGGRLLYYYYDVIQKQTFRFDLNGVAVTSFNKVCCSVSGKIYNFSASGNNVKVYESDPLTGYTLLYTTINYDSSVTVDSLNASGDVVYNIYDQTGQTFFLSSGNDIFLVNIVTGTYSLFVRVGDTSPEVGTIAFTSITMSKSGGIFVGTGSRLFYAPKNSTVFTSYKTIGLGLYTTIDFSEFVNQYDVLEGV